MQKYGQHFLINQNVIGQVVDAALLLKSENLVEIGPGKGALTEALIARGCSNFSVVEIDPEMAEYLQKTLPKEAAVKIILQNFLQADLTVLAPRPTLFVSNLPYIDAADILDRVLNCPHFAAAVFMFQKEQAQRICARAGEEFYGPLSIFSQLRAQTGLICNVGRGCFNPPPKVESRVLAFTRLKQNTVAPAQWPAFKKLVTSAFLHKRKTLFNSLSLAGYDKEKIRLALDGLKLAPTVRPEQVSPAGYVDLLARLQQF